MSNQVKVAVCQMGSVPNDMLKTLLLVEKYAQEAHAAGVGLIVFPEATLGGYPKFSSFGASVGHRTDEGRDEYLAYHKNALAVPSQTTIELAKIAASNNLSIVIGVIERERGTLYCTVLYIDPKQGLVGKHRKLVPTASERIIWGCGDGTTIDAHDLQVGNQVAKTASSICWESQMMFLRYHYYTQGVQLYCTPTVDARESWLPSMQHIAQEGRCFVLSACQYSTAAEYPAGHPAIDAADEAGEIIAGGSSIVSPLGKVLAGPLRGKAGLLMAEIDLDDCIRGNLDMDITGHYSRPDVFKFSVVTGAKET